MARRRLRSGLFLLFAAAASCSGFEMVDHSPEVVTVKEGEELHLLCSADVPYNFCMWDRDPMGERCTVTAESSEATCVKDTRVFWKQSGTTCGIMLESVDRLLDAGTYNCKLINPPPADSGDSSRPDVVEATMVVDVVSPAGLHFGAEMIEAAAGDSWAVKSQEAFVVECHATGAYPQAEMVAYLGSEDGPIDEENDEPLMLTEGATSLTENDDGSFDLVQFYTHIPHMSDCGKFVKCAARQVSSDGEEALVGLDETVITQRIRVEFPPQPLMNPEGATVTFSPGDAVAEVSLTFMANPVPEDNQAIWYITPWQTNEMPPPVEPAQQAADAYDYRAAYDAADDIDGDVNYDSANYYDNPFDYGTNDTLEASALVQDSIAVQAGQWKGEKYEALALNVTGHEVTAVLRIYNLVESDMDFDYHLMVTTSAGEQQYDVDLVSLEDNSSRSGGGSGQPGTYGATSGVKQGTDEAGIGTATIAVIVVVVLVVFFGISFVIWAKRYKKCCFHDHHHGHGSSSIRKQEVGPGLNAAETGSTATAPLTADVDHSNKQQPSEVSEENEKPESEKNIANNKPASGNA